MSYPQRLNSQTWCEEYGRWIRIRVCWRRAITTGSSANTFKRPIGVRMISKGQYISYWDLQGRSYFSVPGEWVDFEGLQIRVNANLGMETTNRERYALKWWLNANRPTMTYRRFFTLLMRMLKPGVWEDGWIPALWDVRQGDILPPVEPTGADVLVVNAAASTFASYWNRIEEQAERGRRTLYDNT